MNREPITRVINNSTKEKPALAALAFNINLVCKGIA